MPESSWAKAEVPESSWGNNKVQERSWENAKVQERSWEKDKKRPLAKSKDKMGLSRVSEKNGKSGKGSGLKREERSDWLVIDTEEDKYTFRTVRSRAAGGRAKPGKAGSYNLFSCLDEPIDRQCQNQEATCARNEIVAPKLGAYDWKK